MVLHAPLFRGSQQPSCGLADGAQPDESAPAAAGYQGSMQQKWPLICSRAAGAEERLLFRSCSASRPRDRNVAVVRLLQVVALKPDMAV